ncbi:MAG: hypothetical protein KDK90_25665 [Leptospiraceae bacterium]|nr:hypothetical protein [Leptospiraceae bacterium]
MNKVKIQYSPSINIVRDEKTELNYIPTPNATIVYEQLIKNYDAGFKSFSLIGNYGTGKSAFLLAFEKHLKEKKSYWEMKFSNHKKYEFKKIIGEYSSVIQSFAKHFEIKNRKQASALEVLEKIDLYYQSLIAKNKQTLLIIEVDEFGKFLEYANKNDSIEDIYFIQQLSEYINSTDKNILFIVALHQNFTDYANQLNLLQKKEWEKVKGRLKELSFNEPVEQLIYLASVRLSQFKHKNGNPLNLTSLFNCIKSSNLLPLRDYLDQKVAEKLYPLDILSAAILTQSLQRYGQNERSLFSFIESNDYLGIQEHNKSQSGYYSISSVYDYLNYHYYFLLSTKMNPDYLNWSSIKNAIEKVEGFEIEHTKDAINLIKTIGLLNLFGHSGKIDDEFLCKYAKMSMGIAKPEKIINQLQKQKIVRYVQHSKRYKIFDGTDLDIDLELAKASQRTDSNINIIKLLNESFDFSYIPAKAISYKKGIPRYFAFYLSEKPTELTPEGEIDGYINLIFSHTITENEVENFSENCKKAILFGFYRNTKKIKNCLFEMEVLKKVIQENHEDKVAIRELNMILLQQKAELNRIVVEGMYQNDGQIRWFFRGQNEEILSPKGLNQKLSEIVENVYPHAVTYQNEMINKTKISSAIITARKNLVRNLMVNLNEEDLGIPKDKYPPEKTIYLSLLKETGIHRFHDGNYWITEPKESSIKTAWKECKKFLESAKHIRKNLKELYHIFYSPPYKLKKGFLDYFLPIFLFVNKEDFALFGKGIFLQNLTEDTLELVVKNPENFEIKSFDIAGIKLEFFNQYRILLNQSQREKIDNQSFVETIKPFLIFYKQLPDYTKNTKRLSKQATELRKVIAETKDPESTFFEGFPNALGYSISELQKDKTKISKYFEALQEAIRELRGFYEQLVERMETVVQEKIVGEKSEFPDYQQKWIQRYKGLKVDLLHSNQKVFWNRLNLEIEDRNSYLT